MQSNINELLDWKGKQDRETSKQKRWDSFLMANNLPLWKANLLADFVSKASKALNLSLPGSSNASSSGVLMGGLAAQIKPSHLQEWGIDAGIIKFLKNCEAVCLICC